MFFYDFESFYWFAKKYNKYVSQIHFVSMNVELLWQCLEYRDNHSHTLKCDFENLITMTGNWSSLYQRSCHGFLFTLWKNVDRALVQQTKSCHCIKLQINIVSDCLQTFLLDQDSISQKFYHLWFQGWFQIQTFVRIKYLGRTKIYRSTKSAFAIIHEGICSTGSGIMSNRLNCLSHMQKCITDEL